MCACVSVSSQHTVTADESNIYIAKLVSYQKCLFSMFTYFTCVYILVYARYFIGWTSAICMYSIATYMYKYIDRFGVVFDPRGYRVELIEQVHTHRVTNKDLLCVYVCLCHPHRTLWSVQYIENKAFLTVDMIFVWSVFLI